MEKLSPRRALELTPQLVSMAQQRDVGGMLEIPKSNDAGQAMGGAAVVTGGVPLKPQHALASARQMLERRAPHRAQAADDNIEMSHSVGPASCFSTVAIAVSIAMARDLPDKPCNASWPL
jgi:hypothetical protein